MPAAAATAWNLAASARMRGLAVQARASTRTEQQTKQEEPAVVALKQQQQQQQLPSFLPQQVHQALQPALPVIRSIAKKVGSVDPRIRGLVLLNIMTFVMGTNWVVLKESNEAFDPVVFTSLRFTLAAAAFTPFIRKGLANPAVRKAGMEIGMWTALGYLAQSWALSLTPASRASLLSTFTVIAVPCLAGLSGQKVKPLVWACGLAALVGTTLLEQGGGEPPNVGDLLSIISALFFAMQLFRTEQTSRKLPEGSALPLMSIIVSTVAAASMAAAAAVHWQDAAAAAGSLGHVLGGGLRAIAPWIDTGSDTAQPLMELLYTSFCSTDLVLLIELLALQDVSSTEAALVYSLEPVSGALLAYCFLGERWGPMGWCGAAVILIASLATQLGGALDDNDGSKPGGDGEKEAQATS
uniref:EamA domain-containing protein n=1 Tax=Tetradesmus obliquus TaxID=3088 RepID=A0A383VDB4_TETOB|eukprot:jgi/Sobl393_1/15927/SZX62634.1